MSTKVSIIVPVFNRENILLDTVKSVVDQTYTNWECILIDDGSSDDSIKICQNLSEQDSRFIFLERKDFKTSKGPSSCRNVGIDNANGDYIIFLDSDDLLSKTCLESRIEFASSSPNYDAWIFTMQNFNESGLQEKFCHKFPDNGNFSNDNILKMLFRFEIPFSVTCPLWRKTSLKKIDGFDESFIRLEDPDLHCRALIKGFSFKYNKEQKPDCYYRVDDNYLKRFDNPFFFKIHILSFYIFFKKYLNFYKNNSKQFPYIKEEITKSLLLLFQDNILGNSLGYNYFNKFYFLSLKNNLFNTKVWLLLLVLRVQQFFNLDKLSGSGYHRFRSIVFKPLKS